MTERTLRARPPLTLIVNSQEWHSRSLESILGPHGHAVLRAYTGKQALERAQSAHPDLIILDSDLPDRDGFDVCRDLRADPAVGPATPIIMTSPGHASRAKRLEALRAGAWDFIGSALDGEELPLRLHAFLSAKMEVDRARDESLLDELTGLYNLRGLARRARELGSQAFRQREPFACVVLTPMLNDAEGVSLPSETANAVLESLAQVLRETGRTSDAIGMLGPGEFAVVAQGTDSEGAERLAQRLAYAAANTVNHPTIRMAAGYDAVSNYHDAPIEPSDMLMRASMAMRLSRTEARSSGLLNIRKFEGQLS
ncbi:MAG: response regulator [Gemmatimonadaceae bacterium]|nr:response regulator [Gemmatimonadaceae bacterium]